VFISYATEDRRIATATCRSLEDTGIDCWIAPRDVNPGESWPAAVTSAIERSRVLVVVLSSAAMRSDDVVREITLAAQERVAILPYRVDEVPLTGAFKYYLNPQHWLDASSHPLSPQHLADLERALRRSLGAGAASAIQRREPVATLPPPPPSRRRASARAAAWSTAGVVAAVALLAGPLALLLSSPLHDRPLALGAHRFADLAEARRRVAYYALERGVIWAVVGGAILVAWIWASRSERLLLPSSIGVAFPAAVAGMLGGALYQGAKYASNPGLSHRLNPPDELVIRAASYMIPAAVIGFAFARRAAPLAQSEGALIGAAAGLLAGWLTYLDLGLPRVFSLIFEAAVVGGALAMVAVMAARRRTSPNDPGELHRSVT
jgi:hypothetical protein